MQQILLKDCVQSVWSHKEATLWTVANLKQGDLNFLSKVKHIYQPFVKPYGASLVVQMVKNLPAMQKTRAQSQSQEDLLKKGMSVHSSILAWRIPWTECVVGYSPWGCKELDMTAWQTLSFSQGVDDFFFFYF